ncbi:MAG: hypothetical protein RhofKO_41140 [Rhodothermales bacterium]
MSHRLRIYPPSGATSSHAVARLTALWALAEVGLGGALHALRLPVTGLVVGSTAIVLLALLAEATRRGGRPVRRTLLGATAVVLGVKLAASPHSPVGAYVAVAFQGGLAALLLPSLGRTVGPLVLGVIALAESAVQRVLILTLLFGSTFWAAVDSFVTQVLRRIEALGLAPGETVDASVWLVGAYIGVHLVVGALAGVMAGRLLRRVFSLGEHADVQALAQAAHAEAHAQKPTPQAKAPWYTRRIVRRVGLAVFLIVLYAATGDTGAQGGTAAAVALLRAAVLVTAWAAVVAPLAMRGIQYVARRGGGTRTQAAVEQLPELATLARLAWRQTAGVGVKRPVRFATLVVAAALASRVTAPSEKQLEAEVA